MFKFDVTSASIYGKASKENSEGHKRAALGSYGKKRIFGPKTELKRIHFLMDTMFWPRPGNVVQTLFPIRYHSFSRCRVFFWRKKNVIWAKNHFLAKRKTGRFSVIPARTKSVVILGHFFMTPTVPQSFVDHGPILRVLILTNWESPEMAKVRGEPQKMTHSSETELFLGMVRIGKL